MTKRLDDRDRYSQLTTYFLDRKKPQTIHFDDNFQHALQYETNLLKSKEVPFIRLLGGKEPEERVILRWELFIKAWKEQQSRIDSLLYRSNAQILEDIATYVTGLQQPNLWSMLKIKTAVVLTGANIANHLRFFTQLRKKIISKENVRIVSLTSKECNSLKTTLKLIISHLTEGFASSIDKRVKYDLDLLLDWYGTLPADTQVIISFEDADLFSMAVLGQVISLLQSYTSKMPIKLILGASTSIEILQERLAQSCVRKLDAQPFQALLHDSTTTIVNDVIFKPDAYTLFPGPKVMSSLYQRQLESLDSEDTFTMSLKYLYMTHYYSNPFAVFSQCTSEESILALAAQFDARQVRMLSSFRFWVESLVEKKEFLLVKELMTNDAVLLKEALPAAVLAVRSYAQRVLVKTVIVEGLEKVFKDPTGFNRTDLYLLGLSGSLSQKQEIKHLLVLLEKATTENIIELLDGFSEYEHLDCLAKLSQDLYTLIGSDEDCADAVANNVSEFIAELDFPYQKLFMQEVLFIDHVSLLESAFLPTYRGAIETALSNPRHYLGNIERDPHLSILYELSRESSVHINLYDYFVAFKARIGEEADDEERALAWFVQGIAELKLIGVLKDNKRKPECVEKVTWRKL
ncbi:hypothetical protein TRVA0_012S03224 [Trichomonascus vanleenenianus]|uniref:origin recognition complex subunit 3 n=1 Tax=Trichomonascus vanleenenianus TaxID=2268995 RepID=UPI003ECB4545